LFRSSLAGDRNSTASGLTFSYEQGLDSMSNEAVYISVYEWNDVFVDIYSPPIYNSINVIDQTTYIYQDESLSGINIYAPFSGPISLQNNQRYLFCVNSISDNIKSTYDNYSDNYNPEGIDYTTTVNHYGQPISPVAVFSSENSPYGPRPYEWVATGFGYDNTAAISVTMDIATGVNDSENENSIVPYPNPATNYLTIPVRKRGYGNANVELFDIVGKLILSETVQINNEPLKLNVSAISNGNYIFKLTFNDGATDSFKISINR